MAHLARKAVFIVELAVSIIIELNSIEKLLNIA